MTDAPYDGSTPLKNARHEAFAISYVGHGNATRAYIDAGYNQKAAGVSGHHLLKNPNVQARVDNLRLSKFKALHMGTDELLSLVAGQARNPLPRMIHVTADGDPFIDLSKASPEDLAHLTEVVIEDFTDGREIDDEGNVIKRDVRRVKIKVASPDAARTTLMRHHGLLKDKVEVSLDEDFAKIMERQQRAAREAAKAAED